MRVKVMAASLAILCSTSVVAAVNISAPDEIKVIAINDQEVKTGLLSKKNDYVLTEGIHKIAVRYNAFFEHHDHSHDVLKSDVFTIHTPVLKSGKYHLSLINAPQDFEAAKQYQQQPIIGLYDQNKNLLVQQVGTKASKSSWLNSINVITTQTETSKPTLSNDAGNTQSDQALIQLWQKSSKDERQKFMQWIAEQSK